MPRETRKLLFDLHELETTALGYCRCEGIVLPWDGHGIMMAGTGPATALRFGNDEVRVDQRQLGATLFDHCQATGAPIPRGALKLGRAEADGIFVMIEPEGIR